MATALMIRWLGRQPYTTTWDAMQTFTNQRTADTPDEIWLLEHDPIFTQGQNGKPEHILNAGEIPIVQTDRGGQVTYHGPGQLMAYILIDLRRRKLNVRELVTLLENSVIQVMAEYNIIAYGKVDAPGVYVNESKICSIGLRIRRGCSYHGIAFNINMDLAPFSCINPCGFQALQMAQTSELCPLNDVESAGKAFTKQLLTLLPPIQS